MWEERKIKSCQTYFFKAFNIICDSNYFPSIYIVKLIITQTKVKLPGSPKTSPSIFLKLAYPLNTLPQTHIHYIMKCSA